MVLACGESICKGKKISHDSVHSPNICFPGQYTCKSFRVSDFFKICLGQQEAYDAMRTISLLFYYRIFAIARFRRLLAWVGIISVAFMIAAILGFTFQW